MKLLKCCFISTFFTTWLLSFGPVAVAADFDLGIATSSEGKTLGENLIINKNETTGELYLTTVSGDDSRLILPVSLSNKFEIVMVVGGGCWYIDNIFLAADADKTSLWWTQGDLGSYAGHFSSDNVQIYQEGVAWQGKTFNTFKWSFDGSIAKLYINDLFADKKNLTKPDLIYTQLVLRGISHNCHIYELKGGDGSGISTPTTGGDFESGKQAGIQQCVANPASCSITVTGSGTGGVHASFNPGTGELYVPFVDVPGTFGGVQTYEVYLVQQPLTFTFDLDLGRVVLK